MRPRRRPTSAALGALAVLAGCGGEPEPVLDRDATLRIRMDEYVLEPAAIRVRATARPMRVVIDARNVGRLNHNVRIEEVDPAAAQGTDADPILFGGTPTAKPGERVEGEVFLQPGTYRMSCTISNHDNLGQYGTLVVEPPRQ